MPTCPMIPCSPVSNGKVKPVTRPLPSARCGARMCAEAFCLRVYKVSLRLDQSAYPVGMRPKYTGDVWVSVLVKATSVQ